MAVKHWSAQAALYEFSYDGGVHSPVADEVIYVDGEEGTEYATIFAWTVASGAWGTSDAAGKMWVYAATEAFITNLEGNDVIEDSGTTKICDTTGGVTDVEGHWDAEGNWGSGEDPSLPAAADEVIFDSYSVVDVSDGIAVDETGGIDFDLLHIKEGYSGTIGAAGSPLHTSAQKVIIEGSGAYYIEVSEDATGKDQTIPLVIINNKNATVYLTSNQNDGSWCCEFTELLILAGTVYIGHDGSIAIATAVEYLRISPLNNKSSNVTVQIYEDCARTKATAYKTSIYIANGTCLSDSAAEIIELFDGTFYYGSEPSTGVENSGTGMDITTLRLHGGTFNWEPDDTGDDAYIGDLFVFGGTFNASGTTNADRAKILGNGAGNDIWVFEGSLLKIDNGRGNITIAASSQLWNFGGIITMDSGAEIGVSYDQP